MTTEAAAKLYLAQHEYEHENDGIAVFNPHNKPFAELPAIMCFSNVKGGGDGIAYAIAEDGECLGSHWCSHEGYVKHDLGVYKGSREDRHETYRKHYPDGYRMEFIRSDDVMSNEKLEIAFKLNQAKAKAREDNANDKT